MPISFAGDGRLVTQNVLVTRTAFDELCKVSVRE